MTTSTTPVTVALIEAIDQFRQAMTVTAREGLATREAGDHATATVACELLEHEMAAVVDAATGMLAHDAHRVDRGVVEEQLRGGLSPLVGGWWILSMVDGDEVTP
jgi:hypothetical protein